MPVGAGVDLIGGGSVPLLHKVRRRMPAPGIGVPGGAPQSGDHRWVTDTVLAIVQSAAPRATVLLYEDLPYAWQLPGDGRATTLARRCGRA